MTVAPQSGDPGREALLGWLKDRVNADVALAPELLWHYTDASGMRGIIENERLWATQTSFLNDSTEIAYGLGLAREAIRSIHGTGMDRRVAGILGGLTDPDGPAMARFVDERLDVYVACFCGDGDLLSQWRAYAGRDEAGGYALGIGSRPPLQAWVQSAPGEHGLSLRRVLYDREEQMEACRQLVKDLVPILEADPDDEALQMSFIRNMLDGLVEIATWCKHPAFAEEQEWRVVYVRNQDPFPLELQHRPSRGLIVPFVALDLSSPVGSLSGHLPVQHINLGPGPDPTLKKRGVDSLLSRFPHYSSVQVEGSSAPLRL